MTAITTGPALSHLRALEAEAIYILREVAAQREKPALLFSGGKDSSCCSGWPRRRSRPAVPAVPAAAHRHRPQLPRGLAFRDARVAALGEKLIVRSVEDSIARGTVKLRGTSATRATRRSR